MTKNNKNKARYGGCLSLFSVTVTEHHLLRYLEKKVVNYTSSFGGLESMVAGQRHNGNR